MIPAANGPLPGHEREGRRRHDADDVDVDAEARRAGRDGRHEHVARATRVLARRRSPHRDRRAVGDGPAERVGEGRLQVDVGDAADPVGAEQAGHRGQPPGWGDAPPDGVVTAVELIVTATVGGLMATSVVPTGRFAGDRDVVGPGLEAGDVEVHHQGRAGQPVEVGRGAADRDQHAVDRERVGERVAGADAAGARH